MGTVYATGKSDVFSVKSSGRFCDLRAAGS